MLSLYSFLISKAGIVYSCKAGVEMVIDYLVSLCLLPSIGELASTPTIEHDLRVVYTQIVIG